MMLALLPRRAVVVYRPMVRFFTNFDPDSHVVERYPHINRYCQHLLRIGESEEKVDHIGQLLKENAKMFYPLDDQQLLVLMVLSAVVGGHILCICVVIAVNIDYRRRDNKQAERGYEKFIDEL
jgi:hypothetical protein